MEKQTIGSFMQALRKAKGFSQQEVADSLGVSNKTISSWETDKTTPDLFLLPAIAEIYNVTVDELVKGHRIDDISSSDERVDKITRQGLLNLFSKFKSNLMVSVLLLLIIPFIIVISGVIFGNVKFKIAIIVNSILYSVTVALLLTAYFIEVINLDKFITRTSVEGDEKLIYWNKAYSANRKFFYIPFGAIAIASMVYFTVAIILFYNLIYLIPAIAAYIVLVIIAVIHYFYKKKETRVSGASFNRRRNILGVLMLSTMILVIIPFAAIKQNDESLDDIWCHSADTYSVSDAAQILGRMENIKNIGKDDPLEDTVLYDTISISDKEYHVYVEQATYDKLVYGYETTVGSSDSLRCVYCSVYTDTNEFVRTINLYYKVKYTKNGLNDRNVVVFKVDNTLAFYHLNGNYFVENYSYSTIKLNDIKKLNGLEKKANIKCAAIVVSSALIFIAANTTCLVFMLKKNKREEICEA